MTDSRTTVRYRVRPGRGDENEARVRAVFEELHRTRPEGVDYATYRLEDGVSFLHVAAEGSGAVLGDLDAFRAFQAGLADRAEEPPSFTKATRVGEYRASVAPVAAAFIEAWCGGDFDRVSALVAEDLVFEGPLSSASSREELLALSEPLRPLLHGHTLHSLVAEGERAIAVYDLHIGEAAVTMSDMLTIRDGVVVADRVVFDTAAFSAALPVTAS
jgi:SnoaL-like domain